MTGDSNIMSLRAPPDIKHKHNCSPIMTHHIFDYEYTDDNTVKFECLLNHHYVSGELTSTCLDNGTWTNPSGIVCEVDYYMQRYRLAALIVAITVVFSAVFLGYDFITYRCHYVRLRKTYRARLYAQGPLAIFDFEKSRAKEVLTDRLPNRRFSRINKFTDSRGRLVSTYSLFADLSITTGGSSEASDSTKRTRDYYQPGSSAMPSLRRTVSAPYGLPQMESSVDPSSLTRVTWPSDPQSHAFCFPVDSIRENQYGALRPSLGRSRYDYRENDNTYVSDYILSFKKRIRELERELVTYREQEAKKDMRIVATPVDERSVSSYTGDAKRPSILKKGTKNVQ